MTRDEVVALLTIANIYDDRKPSETLVIAWSEAAQRAHWTFHTAKEAIHNHYAETSDRIMPGHITERIRRTRRRFWDQ
ncbi:hypothetical protein IU449_26730 [Nocardia higoensis]|uniref:Uncharacterized protein n=1 Tax=Nocardia higoensis TaxID=228599 RepID=A0ABS0DI01_9NOCA|nr:hypothetical protein [Nocardia higoensis]MBF6358095.1 hypothetical protein [Nocardia higoensis]